MSYPGDPHNPQDPYLPPPGQGYGPPPQYGPDQQYQPTAQYTAGQQYGTGPEYQQNAGYGYQQPPPPPPKKPVSLIVFGVVLVIVTLVALGIVVVLTRGGDSNDKVADKTSTSAATSSRTSSQTTSASPSRTSTKPAAGFAVNDCLANVPKNPTVDSCTSSAATYKVVEVSSTGSCRPDVGYVPVNGTTYCLQVNFNVNGCYGKPADKEWVVPAATCRAPGTIVVVDVVNGVNDKNQCNPQVFDNSWYYYDPPVTVCFNEF
ncbi:hypothetical protein [Antrihabitans stalactiti]|uniref:Uncharacterized protein n=1 Tax=Antrihabitans stalactiti TaxID=2584121 RepID=A0A848KD64_9NOCA|nr:hypothetical protein [Antrihabitans stalactiti]NMN96785.1 hypothetical protein [Antrihabitans stalactiti]